MDEYLLYTRIIAPQFIADDQRVIAEEQENHTATIVDTGFEEYRLYRFDSDKFDFIPFFNKSAHDALKYPGLTNLRKFCDYILLAKRVEKRVEKLYIFLIEMKSGSPSGAEIQLQAAELFMEFIKQSAERIKNANGFFSFDSRRIIIKKVVVKYVPEIRSTTNVSKRVFLEKKNNHLVLRERLFPLLKICNSN